MANNVSRIILVLTAGLLVSAPSYAKIQSFTEDEVNGMSIEKVVKEIKSLWAEPPFTPRKWVSKIEAWSEWVADNRQYNYGLQDADALSAYQLLSTRYFGLGAKVIESSARTLIEKNVTDIITHFLKIYPIGLSESYQKGIDRFHECNRIFGTFKFVAAKFPDAFKRALATLQNRDKHDLEFLAELGDKFVSDDDGKDYTIVVRRAFRERILGEIFVSSDGIELKQEYPPKAVQLAGNWDLLSADQAEVLIRVMPFKNKEALKSLAAFFDRKRAQAPTEASRDSLNQRFVAALMARPNSCQEFIATLID